MLILEGEYLLLQSYVPSELLPLEVVVSRVLSFGGEKGFRMLALLGLQAAQVGVVESEADDSGYEWTRA